MLSVMLNLFHKRRNSIVNDPIIGPISLTILKLNVLSLFNVSIQNNHVNNWSSSNSV